MAIRTRWLLVTTCGLLLGGCGYPEVSPTTYQISKALYQVCNQKQSERLPTIRELVEESVSSGTMSEREADLLETIIAQAEAGDWESSSAEVRELMVDQTDL